LIPTTYSLPKHLQEKHVPEALYARAKTMTKYEKAGVRKKRGKEQKKRSFLKTKKITLTESELPCVLVSLRGEYIFHDSMEGIATYVERINSDDVSNYQVSLKGFKEDIDRILKTIEHRKQNLVTETLTFPKDAAIPLIGTKGTHLSNFGQSYGVYLKIDSKKNDDGGFDDCKVTMVGLQEEVNNASVAMEKFLATNGEVVLDRWKYEYMLHNYFSIKSGKVHALAKQCKAQLVFDGGKVRFYVSGSKQHKHLDLMKNNFTRFADEKLIRLPVNSSGVPNWLKPSFGDTKGNKDAYLLKKRLMQDHNVTLYDSSDDDSINDGEYWIVGPDNNETRQFQIEFFKFIDNSITIDNSIVPRLLGQIKKIQDTTDTFIQLLYKDATEKENVILIVGDKKDVANATSIIKKTLNRASFESHSNVLQTQLTIRPDIKYDWSTANEFINCSVQHVAGENSTDEVKVYYDNQESLQMLKEYIQKRNLHADGNAELLEAEIYLPNIIAPQILGRRLRNLRCLRFFTGADISRSDVGLEFHGSKEQVDEALLLTRSKIEAISQQATDKPTELYEFPVAAVPVFMQKDNRNAINEFTRISAETGTLLQYVQKGLDLRKKTLLIFGTPAQCKLAKQRCEDIVNSLNIESVTIHLDKYVSEDIDINTITDGLFNSLHNFQARSKAALIVRSDTVEIHGDKKYIDKGIQALGDIIETFKGKEAQVIRMPEIRIAEIIGSSGKNIRRLKKISGCSEIRVLDDRAIGVEEGFQQIEFIGGKYQTEIAIDQLIQDLESRDRRHFSLNRRISNENLELLMRDDGEFLRNVMVICDVRISITEEETLTEKDFANVKFQGFGSNLTKALNLIEKYTATGERPDFYEKKFAIKSSNFELHNIDQTTKSIPKHLKQLKMIERNSSSLFKSLKSRPLGMVELSVVGSTDEINMARQLLNSEINRECSDDDNNLVVEVDENFLAMEAARMKKN